eukprot:TRINITY_DN52_c4_g1_i1.p3 TRINITY_DN52_c4_g1~~TRINITY_DN52_c4_g1_i1.p3  ORF type:complete len:450 (-),score=27.93 TRINITY_DN52_c4_g1_i1:9935-11284(-)
MLPLRKYRVMLGLTLRQKLSQTLGKVKGALKRPLLQKSLSKLSKGTFWFVLLLPPPYQKMLDNTFSIFSYAYCIYTFYQMEARIIIIIVINMGKSPSKRSQSLVEPPKRPSKAFFPQIHSLKVLINILDCLYPHEIISLQYTNTFIYEFLTDDMIWMRLTTNNKRLHLFSPDKLLLFYPGTEFPMIKMPIKMAPALPLEPCSVESLEHKFFLIGGYTLTEGKRMPSGDVYEYLERKARIVKKERITEARFNCHAVARQNEIFVMGGENGKEHLSYCEKYIISDNIWISIAFLLTPIVAGTIYSLGDYIYHIEPKGAGQMALNTYNCNNDHWEGMTIAVPGSHSIEMLNFCEVGKNDNELILLGDKSVFLLDLAENKISHDKGKMCYGKELEGRKWSHTKIGKDVYGISDKCFIKYEEEAVKVEIIKDYGFEEIIPILRYNSGGKIQRFQ